MPFNIVCPSSRGLSLAISRALLQRTPHPLIATARRDPAATKSRILEALPDVPASRVTVLRVDVTDEPSIAAAAAAVRSQFPHDHAQYVFSTAGILHPERSVAALDRDAVLETFAVNVVGPLMLLKHFGPFMPGRKDGGDETGPAVWANMSARVGSIGDNRKGGWYSYRASKAAVNAVTRSWDIELQRGAGSRACAVALHPGTVKTGLSKEFWAGVPEGKLFEPEFAAGKLLDVVMGLDVEKDRGLMFDWKGERVEW